MYIKGFIIFKNSYEIHFIQDNKMFMIIIHEILTSMIVETFMIFYCLMMIKLFMFYSNIDQNLNSVLKQVSRAGYSVGPHSGRLVLLWATMKI